VAASYKRLAKAWWDQSRERRDKIQEIIYKRVLREAGIPESDISQNIPVTENPFAHSLADLEDEVDFACVDGKTREGSPDSDSGLPADKVNLPAF
jgi:hypothetical protein